MYQSMKKSKIFKKTYFNSFSYQKSYDGKVVNNRIREDNFSSILSSKITFKIVKFEFLENEYSKTSIQTIFSYFHLISDVEKCNKWYFLNIYLGTFTQRLFRAQTTSGWAQKFTKIFFLYNPPKILQTLCRGLNILFKPKSK